MEDNSRSGTKVTFWGGFLITAAIIMAFTAFFQLALMEVGELGIRSVVARQLAARNERLFASGLHQQAIPYKMALLQAIHPDVVAIGSSRAMQVRAGFFRTSFVNFGGTANDVANLEAVADRLARDHRPKLAIVFVDPWWFNDRFDERKALAGPADFPGYVSASMIARSVAGLRRGNWFSGLSDTADLGIFSLIRGEGYSRDGSFHYRSTITGERKSLDYQFSDTFKRIAGDRQRFERSARADMALVQRACTAFGSLRRTAGHVVVIAPPVAPAVWKRMGSGYGYIDKAFAGLRACNPDIPFFSYIDPHKLPAATDCEFIDGFHGGDTIYARLLHDVARVDRATGAAVDAGAVDTFIERFAGFAGGGTLTTYPDLKETDFLGLGCRKSATRAPSAG